MMNTAETKETIRAFAKEHQLSSSSLAKKANLHPNSLRGLKSSEWNPTSKTLEALEAVILEMQKDGNQ